MIIFEEKKDCTGCQACKDKCPIGAISMEYDEEGFYYPVIDQDKCINCSLCSYICPINFKDNYKSSEWPNFYVSYHKSDKVLKESTSGGAFTALSDAILSRNGSVYGACFDDDFKVVHKRAASKEERDLMRVSKYVQSDMSYVYKDMQKDLELGIDVLFTGTPCQTSGIKARFHGSKFPGKLYICDLICHSIPSPALWRDYLSLLEDEGKASIEKLQFRSKKYAWSRENSNKGFLYKFKDEDEYREDDRFYDLFIGKNYIVRPSCYDCKFTDVRRASDLTIADYWGIEDYDKKWYNSLGVSLLMVNSVDGQELFNMAKEYLEWEKRPGNEAMANQGRLKEPIDEPDGRSEFWKVYKEDGLKEAIKL